MHLKPEQSRYQLSFSQISGCTEDYENLIFINLHRKIKLIKLFYDRFKLVGYLPGEFNQVAAQGEDEAELVTGERVANQLECVGINANIARMVATRVESKFAGAAVGDKDMLETYMEQVVKSLSVAEFSRVVIEDEFWIKKQSKKSGEVEYRYLFLVTVPKSEIEAAIERVFGDAESKVKPKTEEETAARDRVKEAFKEGF